MDNDRDSTGVLMEKTFTDSTLARESMKYHGTGGASQGNSDYGFLPAFRDTSSDTIYLSRYSDGRLAKVHILDGMPDNLIVSTEEGHVKAVSKSVIAGFVLNGVFYTRAEAANVVSTNVSKSA
ncbi:MAG: hypothetical protein ACC653_04940 [Gammaproteobacteria bacterium]